MSTVNKQSISTLLKLSIFFRWEQIAFIAVIHSYALMGNQGISVKVSKNNVEAQLLMRRHFTVKLISMASAAYKTPSTWIQSEPLVKTGLATSCSD
jgi:hypothetical protein